MLELIVLGQIPGTQIQITFAWFLFAALGILGYILHKAKRPASSKEANQQLKLF
jgi:hypothetical protein